MELQILYIGNRCPRCGSGQFSVTGRDPRSPNPDWPDGVIGVSDCRGCDATFLVMLAPEKETAVMALLADLPPEAQNAVRKRLFPKNKKPNLTAIKIKGLVEEERDSGENPFA